MTVSRRRTPAEFLPLSPSSFHILLALVDGEQHGYAIMRLVTAATDGTVRLGPGTIYRVVSTLLAGELIEEVSPKKRNAEDERRRYYRLTPLGLRVVSEDARRLAAAVDMARAKRLVPRTR